MTVIDGVLRVGRACDKQTRDTFQSSWTGVRLLAVITLDYGFILTAGHLQATLNKHAQVNSASYPQRDVKYIVAHGLRGKGLVWPIGAVVCLLAAPWVQLFTNASNGWPHSAMRCH